MPLINCEINIDFPWSKECIISEISIIPAVPGNPNANLPFLDVAGIQTTIATFQINNAKLYVTVVALSINDNIKFLKNIKQGFKRTIYWNKFGSEIKTQQKNNNLDYLVDSTFRNIIKLLANTLRNIINLLANKYEYSSTN